jgi:predicted nucleotidyltransferase
MGEFAIPINKEKIKSFCRKHHIVSLALFGSILTPSFSPSSDVDVLVQFNVQHTPSLFEIVDIESELSSIVGRQVDLKTPNDLSPYFRNEVLSKSKILYE